MLTVNTLERSGKIAAEPIVELFAEARFNSLSGTFRFSHNNIKIAIYFADGAIVFAQTNLRAARLGAKLVQSNLLRAEDLQGWHDLPDVELAQKLLAANKINCEQLAACQNRLIAEIVRHALELVDGEWTFNPLVRVREELRASIELPVLLVERARRLPIETAAKRFGGDPLESLAPAPNQTPSFDLTPEEAFVLSRIEGLTSAANVSATIGLPESKALAAVYVLWLGGLIRRFNYAQIFDEKTVEQFRRARLKLRESNVGGEKPPPPDNKAKIEAAAPIDAAANNGASIAAANNAAEPLEDYLRRVETARNHYEIFGVPQTTETAQIKTAYFRFAKQFHPDKFHHDAGSDKHARLQNAFTRVAAAYEALKDQKSRELYDFKLQKEAEQPAAQQRREEAAFKPEAAYEQGVAALQSGDFAQAVAFLTRAAQLAPTNAEYHARLGQALAVNPKFRHKAEAEFQAALKLDEKNAQWRLLIAEFYVLAGLNRRAETELNRLLVHDPDNALALEMLGKIK